MDGAEHILEAERLRCDAEAKRDRQEAVRKTQERVRMNAEAARVAGEQTRSAAAHEVNKTVATLTSLMARMEAVEKMRRTPQ